MSRPDELFEQVRRFDPVPPGAVHRVRHRLGARRTRPRLFLPAALAAALAAMVLLWLRTPATPPAPEKEVASIPVEVTPAPEQPVLREKKKKAKPVVAKKLHRQKPDVSVVVPDTLEPPAPEEKKQAPAVTVVERKITLAPVESVKPEPRLPRYTPRAIVEFNTVDWSELEEKSELPAYVRSIVARRDKHALLAALDQMPVESDLQLVRGRLRIGASRCSDAISDFDAILSDARLDALHPRANSGKDLCRSRH